MKRKIRRLVEILALAMLISTASCYAQFNAGVQGTVQDSKGAVVPNATLTLINVSTGVTQTAVSNNAGVYPIMLPVDTYAALDQCQWVQPMDETPVILVCDICKYANIYSPHRNSRY